MEYLEPRKDNKVSREVGYNNHFEEHSLEPDEYQEYGTSGEKYGWYNGYSDDVIDDAFDGDPEATWNVD